MSFMPFLPNAPEISSSELAEILEGGEPIQIMDVRAPERVARGSSIWGPRRGSITFEGRNSSTSETSPAPG